MRPELKALILDLLREVDSVVANNDWPTEDGRMNEDGDSLVGERNKKIREGLMQL